MLHKIILYDLSIETHSTFLKKIDSKDDVTTPNIFGVKPLMHFLTDFHRVHASEA